MRILIDTNVLVSAALFPSSQVARALESAAKRHEMIICTYVLEEVQSVFERKFPGRKSGLDRFLSSFAYELCYTPRVTVTTPKMRDENDRPILQAAINEDVDAILTGDKDFAALHIARPVILTPAMLLEETR